MDGLESWTELNGPNFVQQLGSSGISGSSEYPDKLDKLEKPEKLQKLNSAEHVSLLANGSREGYGLGTSKVSEVALRSQR